MPKHRIQSCIKPIYERFSGIAGIYRNFRDQLALREVPILTPWGFELAGNRGMAKGSFEPIETQLVRKILREVDVLVNVGANVGYYCCHALSMGKKVIAFEPIQRNLNYLYKNIEINNWSGVEIYPIALSNKVGIVKIYGGNTGASLVKGWAGISENYVTLVPSSTMDTVLGNRLQGKKTIVIVDVEGAEKWMLEGAEQMLNNNPKPIWLMEISVTEHQPNGIIANPEFSKTFKYMFDAGYKAFIANKNLDPVTLKQVDAVQKGKFDILNGHNFLFR